MSSRSWDIWAALKAVSWAAFRAAQISHGKPHIVVTSGLTGLSAVKTSLLKFCMIFGTTSYHPNRVKAGLIIWRGRSMQRYWLKQTTSKLRCSWTMLYHSQFSPCVRTLTSLLMWTEIGRYILAIVKFEIFVAFFFVIYLLEIIRNCWICVFPKW